MYKHLGMVMRDCKYGDRLTKDNYAVISTSNSLMRFDFLVEKDAYADKFGRYYKMEWCEEYRRLCLINLELNLKYFESIDRKEYDAAIKTFLDCNPGFVKATDLSQYKGCGGYYLMLLGEYKQAYIGKAIDIPQRIRAHWTKVMPLDRTLYPMYAVEKSGLSINSFRYRDTTDVYVWVTPEEPGGEMRLINNIPPRFILNRINGDAEHVGIIWGNSLEKKNSEEENKDLNVSEP